MTDTAQPLPDEQADDGSSLTPEMQQRAAALGIARSVLKSSAIFGQSGVQNWTVQDLLTVGDYILGVGPFATLEQIGALPVDSPENRQEGTEVSPGLEYVTTFKPSALDDAEPHQGISVDDDTTALPAYPEDALPR